MNVMTKLTLTQLRQNKKRTRITLIAIALSVAMIVTVMGFIISARDTFRSTIIDTYGDFHVCYVNITPEQAEEISKDSAVGAHFTKNNADGMLTFYFRLKHPTKDYELTAKEIAAKYQLPLSDGMQSILGMSPGSLIEIQYNKDLLAAEGIIANNNIMRAVAVFGGIFILIIVAASVLVISNSFSISTDDRTRQFGILKSVGGTKNQIIHSVLMEGGILSAIGIPIGIIAGLLMEWAALEISARLLPETLHMKLIVSPVVLCISTVLSAVTILVSAYFPAKKASKTTPLDAIRMTNAIKINPKKVKTSQLGQRIFGIEGTLGAKTFKRNRSKYRSTILSLTIAVILFIGVSSFGQFMSKTAQMVYPEYGSDLMIGFENIENTQLQEAENQLEKIPESSISTVRILTLSADNPGDLFSDAFKKNFAEVADKTSITISLIALNDARFDSLCKQSGISPSVMSDGSSLKGIVINRLTSRSIDITPFQFESGASIPLGGVKNDCVLSLMASTETIPSEITFLQFSTMNVIVPEKSFDVITANITDEAISPDTYIMVQSENPDVFANQAEKILSRNLAASNVKYSVINYAEYASMNRNIILLVHIFVYGFIFLLSLIAITSVINTISTSIELRKQEFSMLKSVGMTMEGLNRMLLFENLHYVIKTLCIGIPIGLGVSYLLYAALQQYFKFQYALPWQSLLISIIAVMLILMGMVSYAKRKVKGLNIVETLKMQSV